MRTMFKLWLLLVTLGLASQARAQGPVIAGVAPVFEGGIGYSYVKSNVPSQGNLAMKGIVASASGDLNAHFGAKLEVGYSRSFDAFQTGRAADILTYMGGPVFYPIRRQKFDIHAQVLAGGARETGVNFESGRNAGAGIREPLCVGGRRGISIPDVGSIVTAAGSRVPAHFLFQFQRGDPGADQLANDAQLGLHVRAAARIDAGCRTWSLLGIVPIPVSEKVCHVKRNRLLTSCRTCRKKDRRSCRT